MADSPDVMAARLQEAEALIASLRERAVVLNLEIRLRDERISLLEEQIPDESA